MVLRCNVPGCKSFSTFTRNSDLTRHMKKHKRQKHLSCPVGSCTYHNKPFYRVDKLTDHLNVAHDGDESAQASCPAPRCQPLHLPLSLMKIHAYSHTLKEIDADGSGGILRALVNSSPCKAKNRRPCRVPGCRDVILATELHNHVRAHTQADRLRYSHQIQGMGFDAVTADLICPLCDMRLTSQQQLAAHINYFHSSLLTNLIRSAQSRMHH